MQLSLVSSGGGGGGCGTNSMQLFVGRSSSCS
jgi:hypothetical protein